MDIAMVIVGLLLLLMGRRLFWLAVACLGMVTGVTLAEPFLAGQPVGMIIGVGLGAALLGALLALFVQKIAVGVAGFLGGGFLGLVVLQLSESNVELQWLFFLIGGFIGAFLLLAFFDWALIGITSLAGSALVVQSLAAQSAFTLLLLALVAVIGAAIQARSMMPVRT